MASALRRVLADGTLVAVGSAIALAWALFRVANAIGTLVVSAMSAHALPAERVRRRVSAHDARGDRVLVFGPLLEAAVTLALVLAVVLWVYRLRR